jgi:hypothetical protein
VRGGLGHAFLSSEDSNKVYEYVNVRGVIGGVQYVPLFF